MARATFQVEVLTPEGEVFNEEVEMLSTRTTTGSIGILANHTPLLGLLEPAELRLYRGETEIVRFAQGEGYIQVGGNRALVLVEDAIDPGALGRDVHYGFPESTIRTLAWMGRQAAHETEHHLADITENARLLG